MTVKQWYTPISPRQEHMLRALNEGYSPQEYAQTEGIALSTVRWHIKMVLRNTKLHSYRDVIALQRRQGILPTPKVKPWREMTPRERVLPYMHHENPRNRPLQTDTTT